mgnify:CR=1 FL=1
MTGNQNSPLGVVELGRYVKRAEARERLGAYLRSLLGEIERRNSWQLAEHQGDTRPYGFQPAGSKTVRLAHSSVMPVAGGRA